MSTTPTLQLEKTDGAAAVFATIFVILPIFLDVYFLWMARDDGGPWAERIRGEKVFQQIRGSDTRPAKIIMASRVAQVFFALFVFASISSNTGYSIVPGLSALVAAGVLSWLYAIFQAIFTSVRFLPGLYHAKCEACMPKYEFFFNTPHIVPVVFVACEAFMIFLYSIGLVMACGYGVLGGALFFAFCNLYLFHLTWVAQFITWRFTPSSGQKLGLQSEDRMVSMENGAGEMGSRDATVVEKPRAVMTTMADFEGSGGDGLSDVNLDDSSTPIKMGDDDDDGGDVDLDDVQLDGAGTSLDAAVADEPAAEDEDAGVAGASGDEDDGNGDILDGAEL